MIINRIWTTEPSPGIHFMYGVTATSPVERLQEVIVYPNSTIVDYHSKCPLLLPVGVYTPIKSHEPSIDEARHVFEVLYGD